MKVQVQLGDVVAPGATRAVDRECAATLPDRAAGHFAGSSGPKGNIQAGRGGAAGGT